MVWALGSGTQCRFEFLLNIHLGVICRIIQMNLVEDIKQGTLWSSIAALKVKLKTKLL